MTPPLRRLAALAATCLLASLVPVLGLAAPAQAAGCQEESSAPIFGCDDTTPPDTALGTATPAMRASGYVRQSSVAFAFTGTPADVADLGVLGFECQLFATAAPPAQWQTCTSGQVWSGLTPTTTTPYTFRVRAVDTTDAAVVCPGLNCAEVPDYDATPASITFRVDTTAPNTFLTRTPQDQLRPDWPVLLSRTATVSLNSNEAASFACTLNGKSTACTTGTTTLSGLKPGNQVFKAQAVDAAGNLDPTPATTTFFVPDNLKAATGWTKQQVARAFSGDVVVAKKVGTTMRLRGMRGVRELRLIAPSGPRLGRIEVRIGKSQWYPVSLNGKKSAQRSYQVRDQYSPAQSGAVLIRVVWLPRGGSIQLDAVVARK